MCRIGAGWSIEYVLDEADYDLMAEMAHLHNEELRADRTFWASLHEREIEDAEDESVAHLEPEGYQGGSIEAWNNMQRAMSSAPPA